MQIQITQNIGASISLLDKLQPRFPLALAKALTQTAQDIRAAELQELRRSIDRPTPYTERQLRYVMATPQRLEAHVGFDISAVQDAYGNVQQYVRDGNTPASKYMAQQVTGGPRGVKRFEAALQAAGLMPKGWHAVPGRSARLDQFGNISRGQIIQILSQLRVTQTAGYTRNLRAGADKKSKAARARAFKKAGGQYFAVTEPGAQGKLPPGIYQRASLERGPVQRAVRAILIFVPTATYRRRFAFDEVALRTAKDKFETLFAYQMDAAMRGTGARS